MQNFYKIYNTAIIIALSKLSIFQSAISIKNNEISIYKKTAYASNQKRNPPANLKVSVIKQ